MKKRYVILTGVLALALLAAGCGQKTESDTDSQDTQDVQVTVTPAADSAETTADTEDDDNLVDMQESTEESISNVMGEQTATATKVIFINGTGSDVARLYVRAHVDDGDDSEWGDDLIQGSFTLANGDKAVYYFDASAVDSEGNVPSSYDIRIIYTDENLSECYFRDIPLQNVTQITLRMDGTGEDSIPYATYTQGSSKQEISTLEAVKKRLGLDVDVNEESSEAETEEETSTAAQTETEQTEATQTVAVEPTATPTPVPEEEDDDTEPTDSGAETAKTYIGQSLEELIAACGEPSASEYHDEPETGETGYHYYSTFTVSTSVDEDGNEVVAGVW